MEFTEKVRTEKYPSYIDEERRAKPTPDSLVADGKAQFGTYDAPFKDFDLTKCEAPLGKGFPKALLGRRIKAWEAYEISFDEGFIVGAIYSIGVAMTIVMIFFDKRSGKVTSNQYFTKYDKTVLKNTLINSRNTLTAGAITTDIKNNFEKGKVKIKSVCVKRKKNTFMDVDVDFTSVTMPSVGVMPFGKNRPLYSQKEMFSVEGKITIGEETFLMNERSLAIIDDHRGYYPYKMHYDWVTGLGVSATDGIIGFNLTKNQSVDPVKYNENFLWLKGEIIPLPPIDFTHNKDGGWTVKDKYGAVSLDYEIADKFRVYANGGLIKVDYTAPFGYLYGFIKDNQGTEHRIDGLFGMGEDKTYYI